jgi:hypothetical protein
LPTAPRARVRGMRHVRGAVDNSAPLPIRPQPTYKSGKFVQTNGATFRGPLTKTQTGCKGGMQILYTIGGI